MTTRYTTAPRDYDGFGTVHIGIVGVLGGRPLRKVEIRGDALGWQEQRYWSGGHRPWAEIPPATDQTPTVEMTAEVWP